MQRITDIRIAIVDDHVLVREAIANWIESSASDMRVVLSVSGWGELMSHTHFPVPIVLLDVDLKDAIPISVKIQSIRTTGSRVVLMSALTEVETIRSAFDAGALSYIVKSEPAATIVTAIRAAAAGEPYVSDEMARLLDYPVNPSKPKLTKREQAVMSMYASGQAMKTVAATLFISEDTARSYMKRIRDKYRAVGIDLGNKVALRDQAIRDGYLID
jgi:DNA-binding NarL/FixJ family response regulator